jgi:peptidoglycan DL-endopeptidase CwlO
VRRRPSGVRTLFATLRLRGVAVPFGLLAVGLLVVSSGGVAAGAPRETIPQIQAQLSALNNKAQALDEQYDAAQAQLTAANQELASIDNEIARDEARFKTMHRQMADIADTFYENGSLTTPEVLLTSGNPQQILNQSSILLELSSYNSDAIDTFLAAARQLAEAQQAARRIQQGKLAIRNELASEKAANAKLIDQQEALLAQLTPVEAADTGPGGLPEAVGEGSGNTAGTCVRLGDPLPASTPGEVAVAYAYAQLCCPYVYAGVGPCADGFDCSGLTMMAWAQAGVSMAHYSYTQMDSFPSVPLSELQVGDILGFAGNSHVGIYVGDGYLIDAPETGLTVEKVALTGWYAEELDGAVSP